MKVLLQVIFVSPFFLISNQYLGEVHFNLLVDSSGSRFSKT